MSVKNASEARRSVSPRARAEYSPMTRAGAVMSMAAEHEVLERIDESLEPQN
jgi:hypothetical protein